MSSITEVATIRVTDTIRLTTPEAPAVWDVRWVTVAGEDLHTDAVRPGPVGPQGPPGPAGPAGIIRVEHGDDPTVPRPAGANMVLWVGSVVPLNWDTDMDLIAYT
jgi:hypothetical protein